MKVVIIGGGPAGMLSAISAGTNKNDVTILEKMNMLGRKFGKSEGNALWLDKEKIYIVV